MRLSSLLMFVGIKAPHINGIMEFSLPYGICFAFYISDRKQNTLINGFNSDLSNYVILQSYHIWCTQRFGFRSSLIPYIY